jgi:hypothetical protein
MLAIGHNSGYYKLIMQTTKIDKNKLISRGGTISISPLKNIRVQAFRTGWILL